MNIAELVTVGVSMISGILLIGGVTQRRFASIETRLDAVDQHLIDQSDIYVRIREYDSDKRSTEARLERIESKIDTLLSSRK